MWIARCSFFCCTCCNRQNHSHCFPSLQVVNLFELQRTLLRNSVTSVFSEGQKGKARNTGVNRFSWLIQSTSCKGFCCNTVTKQLFIDRAVSRLGASGYFNFPAFATIKAKLPHRAQVSLASELALSLHKQVTGMAEAWSADGKRGQSPSWNYTHTSSLPCSSWTLASQGHQGGDHLGCPEMPFPLVAYTASSKAQGNADFTT